MVEDSHVSMRIFIRNGDLESSKQEESSDSDSDSFWENDIHTEVGDWQSKNSSKKLEDGVNSDTRLEEGEIRKSKVVKVALGKKKKDLLGN